MPNGDAKKVQERGEENQSLMHRHDLRYEPRNEPTRSRRNKGYAMHTTE